MNLYNLHKSDPRSFPQLTFKDQLFLYYNCPQTEHVVQCYLNHNQLNFTISGKRIIHHGEKTWIANSNRGLLLKRGAFLQELPLDNTEWEVLVFYLKDDYLKSIFEEFRPFMACSNLPPVDPYMIQEFAVDTKISNSYKSLLPYFKQPQLLPDSIFEAKFKELLFNVFVHPSNKQILAYVNQIIGGYVVPVWQVMEANYMFNLRITDFAQMAKRSVSTFRREFEAFYHTTPGKWLTKKRLERAQRLLKESEMTVGEITLDCGYENVSHFSRLFKEHYQVSPSGYRQKAKTL